MAMCDDVDVNALLLNRVLVRLYEDVARINAQIHKVHADVAYLCNTGQISNEDASFILSKVPLATDPAAATLQVQANLQMLSITDSPPPTSNGAINGTTKGYPDTSAASQARRPVPKIPVVNTFQARALWDYNVDNEHPDDLSFFQGDVIEVEENSIEKSEDWWQGKVGGRSGLFPSSYVERIYYTLPPEPAPMVMKSSRPSSEVSAPTYTPYRSKHVAMNSSGGGPNALGLQPTQTDEAKRAKYEHLKSTMANSAASGAGFGAGAALAGGLVRAIF